MEALIDEIAQKRPEEQATMIANAIGVEFCEERRRKVSKRIDHFWRNEAELTGKDKLRVSLHMEAVDLMLSALRD